MERITGWFLKGINFDAAPASLADLAAASERIELSRDELLKASKWEPLLQGKKHELAPGWTTLESLASFRRGIATGSNGFFLLSKGQLLEAGIWESRCQPCVGRAVDVRGLIFSRVEFEAAADQGSKLFLLNLSDPLTEAELNYVRHGEQLGLKSRFLLANRRPWYSMEQRPVAPIWAAVFGRGDLKFVFNEAGVRSLTNFHCIYPHSSDVSAQRALTLCLNSQSVRDASKLHGRVYGGGLNKFEPNDLKMIPVPDLRLTEPALLFEMSNLLTTLHENSSDLILQAEVDQLCEQAALSASRL